MKTSAVQRLRNRTYRSHLRSALRDIRQETSKDAALKKFSSITRLLDRAAQSHLIHKRNADRNKSRLAHMIAKLG